ncbi:hypothetical protein AGDE_13650 [Angomonas deanei]|nr:hypothetical protein AGDE_13650 [Angomonas deanei]|eukprot:EPY21941.1 hypothetical protein AGDE_13650 [Angomonas deanei]
MAGLTDAPEEEDDRPAEIPSPLSTPSPAPMYGWFCGGEGLGYALSGFRFLYRREKVQIPGVIWGFFFDAINTFRNHVEFAAARAAAGKGATGRPLHPLEDGFHRLADGSPDRIFTAASSLPLQLTNLLSFVGGMIVAQGFRTAQDVAPLAYKVPLLSSVLLAAFPPPPLPVEVPNDLYLSARPEKQFVRIFRDYRVASSSEEATSWETTSDEGERDDDSAEVRHRPLHDLLPHVDYEDIPVPFECYCPITRAFMTEPVCTCDGFTYDREAIEEWLHRRRLTSPMTNLPLANDSLRPNLAVRAMLCEVVQQYHALHQKWDQEERV